MILYKSKELELWFAEDNSLTAMSETRAGAFRLLLKMLRIERGLL